MVEDSSYRSGVWIGSDHIYSRGGGDPIGHDVTSLRVHEVRDGSSAFWSRQCGAVLSQTQVAPPEEALVQARITHVGRQSRTIPPIMSLHYLIPMLITCPI